MHAGMHSTAMNSPAPAERPRKRRAINACIACRSSKVRCDGRQPCERCDRNDAECHYRDASSKDPNTSRIERLEDQIAELQTQLSTIQQSTEASRHLATTRTDLNQQALRTLTPRATQSVVGRNLRGRTSMDIRPEVGINAVEKGIVTYDDAYTWFSSFFSGSHWLVPIFSESTDVIASVSARSAFLFDAMVSVGCRAEQGFNSPIFRQLQSVLREHLTHLLITCQQPNLEAVQAIALMAAYSENGYMLIALALRFATQLGLQDATDQLFALPRDQASPTTEESELYRLQRVWHGICNLELL
jgi:hypothetical protein